MEHWGNWRRKIGKYETTELIRNAFHMDGKRCSFFPPDYLERSINAVLEEFYPGQHPLTDSEKLFIKAKWATSTDERERGRGMRSVGKFLNAVSTLIALCAALLAVQFGIWDWWPTALGWCLVFVTAFFLAGQITLICVEAGGPSARAHVNSMLGEVLLYRLQNKQD